MAEDKDPFAEFGGKTITTNDDPFAEFGGAEVKKKISSKGLENTIKPSKIGGGQDLNSLISGTQNKPQAPAILTPEKQREYIKSQKYVKPNTKPKTLTEAVDDDDSYLGALWNQVVGSASDFAGGSTNLLAKSQTSQANLLLDANAFVEKVMTKLYSKALGEGDIKKGRGELFRDRFQEGQGQRAENLGEFARGNVNALRSESSSLENEQEILNGFDVTNWDTKKAAKALPLMITRLGADIGLSIPTAGMSFVAQGYQQGLDDYDRSAKKTGVEPDRNTRELFGIGYGVVNGLFDKLGANAILKNSTVSKTVKNKILNLGIKELSKMEGKITTEAIEQTFAKISRQTLNKIKTAGIKAVVAGASEGGTEAAQGGLSDGLKLLTNKLGNKEVFDADEVKTDFWANRLNDIAGGAILGGALGGAVNGLKSSDSYVAERIAESTTPEQIEEIKAEIAGQVEEGVLDEDRATQLTQAINKYSEANKRLPQGLKPSDRAKALQLISERDAIKEQKLQSESQGKDIDEALMPGVEEGVSILENKEQQKNDEIREITTGEKYKYTKDPEKEDKFYKQLGDGKKEEIAPEYYALQKQDGVSEVKAFKKDLNEDSEGTPVSQQQEATTEMQGIGDGSLENISDQDLENRWTLLEGKLKEGNNREEFSRVEKELEKREWQSVMNVPLEDAKKQLEALKSKESSFIDKQDVRESNEIIGKYENPSSLSDADIKKDFKDALFGNPSTWYADGLKLKQSVQESINRGISPDELISFAEQEFITDGYDAETAKSTVANMLRPVLENQKQSNEQAPTPTEATEQVLPKQGELQAEDITIEQDDTVGDSEVIQNDTVTPEADTVNDTQNDTVNYSDTVAQPVKLTKAAIKDSREQMELPDVELDGVRTDKIVDSEADNFIKSGGSVFKIVDDLISGKKTTVTDTEVAVLTKSLAEKNSQLDKVKGKLMNAVREQDQRAIDSLTIEKEQLVKEVADIQTAGRKASRSQARGLRQFQVSKIQDNTLSGFIEEALRSNGYKALTQEQINQAETAFNEYEKMWTESQAKLAEAEAEIERLKEEYATLKFKKESETSRRRQRANIPREDRIKEIRIERKLILDELSKIAKRQRSTLSSTPITLEYVKPLAQLAKGYIEEGIIELDVLVKTIHGDIKEYIDGVTERDVRDAISGYDRSIPVTRDGIQQQIEELKTQARLISAIEDAESKKDRQIGSKRKEASERVKELRQQLLELTGDDRALSALKVRTKNKIADLNKRLSENDYVMPSKKFITLDEEARVLRDKALKVKREFKIATEKNKLANRKPWEKRVSDINNVVGLVKSLKATWDLSAPFRQGIVASVNHPIIAGKAFWGMHKAAVNAQYYERWVNDLESSPVYQLMEESGLSLTSAKSANMLAKEEDFSSNIAEKIPFGVGKLVKGSERAYSFYLNTLRANIFIDAVTELARDGYTFENNPNEFKSIARVINNETGRGGLGQMERHADLLGLALWSPRLMASRINTFTSIFDPSYTPRARRKATVDLLRFIGAVSAVMFLASANDDWEIEWNPLSSNFGKNKRDNVRYSLMGGMESYITFMARQLTWHTKSRGKIKSFLDDNYKGDNAGDYLMSFFRGKLNPTIGIIFNLLFQKDVVGNKYSLWDVPDEILPLVIPETMDAYNEGGIAEVIKTIPFTTYGVGTSRYAEGENKKKNRKPGIFESIYYKAVE